MQAFIFGRYFLLGKLNTGGMAEVWLARGLRPEQAGRLFAIKRMHIHLALEADFVAMFRDEARIMSGLSHPNIARVYEEGEVDGRPYLVMEFVSGKDLRVLGKRCLQHDSLVPRHLVAFLVLRVAEALDAAHQHRDQNGRDRAVVHRDVSPQNVVVSYDGAPKLIDFGIAKSHGRMAHTEAGTIKGNLGYIAPEMIMEEDVDHRADIFSLGVVLYELLTGKTPFPANDEAGRASAIVGGQAVPLLERAPETPPRLVEIVSRAMARLPEDRYDRAAEVAADLSGYLMSAGAPVTEKVVASFLRTRFAEEFHRDTESASAYAEMELPTPPSDDVPFSDDAELIPAGTGEHLTEVALLAAGYDEDDDEEDEASPPLAETTEPFGVAPVEVSTDDRPTTELDDAELRQIAEVASKMDDHV